MMLTAPQSAGCSHGTGDLILSYQLVYHSYAPYPYTEKGDGNRPCPEAFNGVPKSFQMYGKNHLACVFLPGGNRKKLDAYQWGKGLFNPMTGEEKGDGYVTIDMFSHAFFKLEADHNRSWQRRSPPG